MYKMTPQQHIKEAESYAHTARSLIVADEAGRCTGLAQAHAAIALAQLAELSVEGEACVGAEPNV